VYSATSLSVATADATSVRGALLKGAARRGFDIVVAWLVCRLRRSLSDLIDVLGELRPSRYQHPQWSRFLVGVLGVFSEFERSMIRDRVLAGLDRQCRSEIP
jgi:DNA invertase Pin-like site-specific DNA recombinase